METSRKERDSDLLEPTREIGWLGWEGRREGETLGKGRETVGGMHLKQRNNLVIHNKYWLLSISGYDSTLTY